MSAIKLTYAFLISIMLSSVAYALDLKVMTYNILFQYSWDIAKQYDIRPWQNRKIHQLHILKDQAPHIFSLQEASPYQVDYFKQELPAHYAFYYYHNDERGTSFVYRRFSDVVIAYDTRFFELEDKGHWWLSNTPNQVGSRDFGNKIARIMLWAKLRAKATGKLVHVYATHLDNTEKAKLPMVNLVSDLISQHAHGSDLSILMGDLNLIPKDKSFQVLLERNQWLDSLQLASSKQYQGTSPYTAANKVHIDHVLFKHPASEEVLVKQLTIIDYRRFPEALSDHYPVMTEFVWN